VTRAALALALAGCAPIVQECPPSSGPIPEPVTVHVVDEAGAPVAGARVRLYGSSMDHCPAAIGLTHVGDGETDAAGDVTVPLGRGDYASIAMASRDDRPEQLGVVRADQANVLLGAPRSLHGHVTAEGCTATQISVEITVAVPRAERWRAPRRNVFTADADGNFVADGLGPGHYRATARACDQVLEAEFTGRDPEITLR
jgi:hypothetical protein